MAYQTAVSSFHWLSTINKLDILSVGAAILLAFSFRGYKEQGEFSTLPIQPLFEIVAVGNNQTIGILLEAIERRAIGNKGMAKPRQAAPPMPKSYPVKSRPKSPPKPTKRSV